MKSTTGEFLEKCLNNPKIKDFEDDIFMINKKNEIDTDTEIQKYIYDNIFEKKESLDFDTNTIYYSIPQYVFYNKKEDRG